MMYEEEIENRGAADDGEVGGDRSTISTMYDTVLEEDSYFQINK